MSRIVLVRRLLIVGCLGIAALAGAAAGALGTCGPFTDVAADAFCPFVLEIFTLGITTGTSPTTYDPSANVTRLQMAAFLSRTVDRTLQRGSRRAALGRFSTPKNPVSLGITTLGTGPENVKSDGTDLWVTGSLGTVARVRASDGKLLETWTGAGGAGGLIVAMGSVIVAGDQSPGKLYRLDPSQPAGAVTTVASTLGNRPRSVAFDGARFWTANQGSPGSVSIIMPGAGLPWTVTTVTAGFSSGLGPGGIVYDGANMWVSDLGANSVLKLDNSAAVLLTVTVGSTPQVPVFDGTSIWVPNDGSASVSVVRASTGAVLATLTGNGLSAPTGTAFDGERILVVNGGGDSVSLWKAADLTALGTFDTGAGSNPLYACSDGVNFWITLSGTSRLARF